MAMNEHIPKSRICEKSKKWWNSELTQLKKDMSSKHRIARKNNSILNINIYKEARTTYFETIRKAKRNMWLAFLENAENKEIFDAYKYTKHKNYDKIPFIVYQNKLHVNFEEKCEAFTHAYYSNQSQNAENDFDFESNMRTNQLP